MTNRYVESLTPSDCDLVSCLHPEHLDAVKLLEILLQRIYFVNRTILFPEHSTNRWLHRVVLHNNGRSPHWKFPFNFHHKEEA